MSTTGHLAVCAVPLSDAWDSLVPVAASRMAGAEPSASYGEDIVEMHERAAGYVDRLLKGAQLAICPSNRQQSLSLC